MEEGRSPVSPVSAAPLREANRAYAGKRWADCERLVQEVLAAQPESIQGWRLAGALAFQGNRPDQAQAAFEKVLALAEASGSEAGADDWFNLGSALDQPQRPDLGERAEQAYRKALALGPGDKEAVLRQLAGMLRAQYRFAEARALWEPELDAALASGDRAAQARAYTALGAVALEESRWPAAKPLVEAACEADPAYAESQFSRALGLLAEGDFEAGWPAHEWRWKVSQARGCWRDYGLCWTGDALGERILLVWAEQGLGDAIQFARFLPQLRAAHPQAGLLFVCRRALHPVLAAMAGRERITLMPAEDAVPGRVRGHDVHVPLLSLPLHLDCRLDQLPPPAPLAVSQERIDVWHERMTRFCYAAMPRTVKGTVRGRAARQLGLVWSGSNAQVMAQRRNVCLADLEPLLSVRGVQWHSLQLGPPVAEIATSAWQGCIVDWSHHLKDFGETAALMSCLDGVVSVDTACVHLAASLGRPTWVLSRFDACWRWMAPCEDSPWYPGLKIFNQGSPGEWGAVVRALGGQLGAAACKRTGRRAASEAMMRRLGDARFATRYFVGKGVDLGRGPDPVSLHAELFPRVERVKSWDFPDGDAQYLKSVPDASLDFVHASYCLEHMRNPQEALHHWFRVLKPGGHLVCVVPDEDLCEQGCFPSTFNGGHQWTFTLWKEKSWSARSLSVLELLQTLGNAAQVLKAELLDATFAYDLPRFERTLTPAGESAIEFVVRKRTDAELNKGGRLPDPPGKLAAHDLAVPTRLSTPSH